MANIKSLKFTMHNRPEGLIRLSPAIRNAVGPEVLNKYKTALVSFSFLPKELFGDISANVLFSQRFPVKYLWVNRLVSEYFPGCFTLVIFAKLKTPVFHVKLHNLLMITNFFKYSFWFQFKELMDIFGDDYITRTERFEITYCLLSPKRDERVYLRVFVSELTLLPSLSNLYSSANWLEREVFDMYGVIFTGHSDLRRILTDYGFLGYPLRKDFPLTGFFEIRYDDTARRIVSEGVKLTQELRLFFFLTSWRSLI